jgi:hypothetical protein
MSTINMREVFAERAKKKELERQEELSLLNEASGIIVHGLGSINEGLKTLNIKLATYNQELIERMPYEIMEAKIKSQRSLEKELQKYANETGRDYFTGETLSLPDDSVVVDLDSV